MRLYGITINKHRELVAINMVGVSRKKFSSLGRIVVCPEKIFDSQNGTLTENVVAEKNF
jgi:hypothetical protein